MDITIKYAIFAIGALIIIGILWHAFSKASKQPPQQVMKPGSRPTPTKPMNTHKPQQASKPAPAVKPALTPVKKEAFAKKPGRAMAKTTEPTLGNFNIAEETESTTPEENPAYVVNHNDGGMHTAVAEEFSKDNEVAEDLFEEHHDIAPEVQEELDRAAEKALAASRGEPHQVELPFEDEEVVWDDVVKTTFEKRMQKMPEGVPVAMSKPEPAIAQAVNEFVVLNVIAPRSTTFRGSDIIEILDAQGMKFGKHGIYHGYAEDGEIEFSVASVMEPGYFDLSNIQKFSTPGLSFFLDLGRVASPKSSFKRMLTVVHEVSRRLGGDILDERRQRLTQASVSEYLARIKGVESRRKNYG